jgi:hypothetical protein
MVPQKIKILTLEHGILWNTMILKSELPYCAFTHFPFMLQGNSLVYFTMVSP